MDSTDYDELRDKAKAEVIAELAGVEDPFERRAAAEEARDQAHLELSALKEERRQLIASAALYEYTPQLHERFGIKRVQMKRLALHELVGLDIREDWINPPAWPADRVEAARKARVPHPKNVVRKAEKIAARYEYAEARRDAAVAHLEAAQEAVRRVGGRVKVDALERPDFDEVRRKARDKVMARFAKLVVGPEEFLRVAAAAVDQAEEDITDLLPERDAALHTLGFYTTARGVYHAAGLSRQGLIRAQQRVLGLPRTAKVPPRTEQPAAARAAGVKFVKDAGAELPVLAAAYEAAQARRSAAIEIRDAAIRTLHAAPYGWSRPQLAEAIGRDHKIVDRAVDPVEND